MELEAVCQGGNNCQRSTGESRIWTGVHSVPVSEIIAVRETEVDKGTKAEGKWQKTTHITIETHLCAFTACRPKHLLVYINPYGGKQQGKQIYEHKVAQLFTLASISTDVIGSTDCICYATVGVNDPVTSALHIIVGDSQPMDVCSVHHHNTFLKYSVSLLGYGFYGDVLTDSEKNRWMGPARYDFSGFKTFLSHHYYEGTISFLPATNTLGSPRDSSRCRSGCFVCQHRVKDISPIKWGEGGDVRENEFEGEWKVIKGKFLAINAASMSCACPRSPKGLSPAAHLADGTTDIILVRKCSRLNFLRHLLRHTSKDDQFDLTFVEVYRVKKFKFTPKHCDSELSDIRDVRENAFGQICRDHPSCDCTPVNSNWNCDGEILEPAAIEVGYGIYFFVK
ncbi:UNVERIFIED_CONTAM: hypothetical protein FKN15_001073 [Acipenser sinensis]